MHYLVSFRHLVADGLGIRVIVTVAVSIRVKELLHLADEGAYIQGRLQPLNVDGLGHLAAFEHRLPRHRLLRHCAGS